MVAESYRVLPIVFSSRFPLHILIFTHTANMFSESDLIQDPSTESTDALRPKPSFAPPPQLTDAPSPESFDQEVAETNMFSESDLIQYPSIECTDALRPELFFAPPPQHTDAPSPESFDQEVAELDLDLLFEQFDFLPTFYDSIPVISDPSALTYSTDSVQEVPSSHYSSDFTQSDYPVPSEIESYCSSNNELSGTHDSIGSDVLSNGPPSIQPLHPAEAQFDSRTSDLSPNFVGIYPEDSSISAPVPLSVPLLSTAMQPPTSVVPAPLPVHVTPDSEAHMAPAPDRQFKCPLCPRSKSETI
jgi:hypothetical protein